jgi:hypothetical protein
MPICPKGHTSATDDYCDDCGTPIGVPGIASASDAAGVYGASGNPANAQTCPICGSPRIGRFCEEDGYDFVLRPPISPAPAAPTAVEQSSAMPPGSAPPQSSAVPTGSAAPQSSAVPSGSAPPRSSATPQPHTHVQPATGATHTPSRPGMPAAANGPSAAKPWVAVVTADRDYFETIIAQSGPDVASITFPVV